MSTRRTEYTESVENETLNIIESAAYAGKTIDDRHDRLADRQWRYNDMHINGTLGQQLFDQEVLRGVNFRGAKRRNARGFTRASA